MSTSSCNRIAARHPLCVSSGCHVHPADRPDDGPIVGPCQLDDAFRVHGGALLRFLRRKAGADEAPDLMQEVFARAAGSEQRSRLTNPGGFLRRIAQNLLIDRARRERHGVRTLPLQEHRDAPAAPQQEWGIEADDMLRQYEAAVDALPPKTRRVFLMHRVDELSYRAIHETLGISIATVEYHMVRALAHIAKAVDNGR